MTDSAIDWAAYQRAEQAAYNRWQRQQQLIAASQSAKGLAAMYGIYQGGGWVSDTADEQPYVWNAEDHPPPVNEIYAPPPASSPRSHPSKIIADTPEEQERLWQLVREAARGG